MPNWKIHLEIGKMVNRKIKYNKSDYNLFLLGNILPDINNRYIVKNISKELTHDYTHFKDNQGYIGFYNKYKSKILDNPIICGYFVHLYTDYIWNDNFYNKIKNSSLEIMSADEKRQIKQHEFRVYNNKYILNDLEIDDLEKAVQQCNLVERIEINKDDLLSLIKILQEKKVKDNNGLKVYDIEELDNLIVETIDKISETLSLL